MITKNKTIHKHYSKFNHKKIIPYLESNLKSKSPENLLNNFKKQI